MQVRDLDILNNPRLLFEEKEYYLYGASSAGKQMLYVLEQLGIPVTSFVVSNKSSEGGILGIPVIPVQSLKTINVSNVRIIISSCFVNEIMDTLEQLGLPGCVEVCTRWSVMRAVFFAGLAGESYLSDTFKEKVLLAHNWLREDREVIGKNRLRRNGFLRLLTDENSYLVLNPTKVGSMTICKSLRQIGRLPFHCHTLVSVSDIFDSLTGTKDMWRDYRRRLLESQRPGKRLRIITGVREPISRDISQYWHVFDSWVIYWNEFDSYPSMQESCLEFIKKYTWLPPAPDEVLSPAYGYYDGFRQNRKYGWEFDWYDQCLKRELGVDVYAYPFDREKGYTVIQTDFVEIFLYRMENLNDLEKELAEFVGSPDFRLTNTNTSMDKEYLFAYKEFMKTFKPPRELIDFYYKGNPYMNHFYTEEQKKEMLKRWS